MIAGNVQFRIAVSHSSEVEVPYEVHVIGSKAWAKVTESGDIVESAPGLLGLDRGAQDYPFERAYRTFLDYARGEISRPSTLLRIHFGLSGYDQWHDGLVAGNPEHPA